MPDLNSWVKNTGTNGEGYGAYMGAGRGSSWLLNMVMPSVPLCSEAPWLARCLPCSWHTKAAIRELRLLSGPRPPERKAFFAISLISISSVRPLLPPPSLLSPLGSLWPTLFTPVCLSLSHLSTCYFGCLCLLFLSINRTPSNCILLFLPMLHEWTLSFISPPSLVPPVVTFPATPFEQHLSCWGGCGQSAELQWQPAPMSRALLPLISQCSPASSFGPWGCRSRALFPQLQQCPLTVTPCLYWDKGDISPWNKKKPNLPWLVWQLVGCCPAKRKVSSSIPHYGTCLGCGFSPGWGTYKRKLINVTLSLQCSLPLFLPPFPPP